jgi:hypothetical protein
VGLAPFLGGVMMYGIGIYAIKYYGHAANSEGKEYLGLTLPLWLGGIGMILGVVLMGVSRLYFRPFFARRTETAPPGLLDAPVEHAPTHLMGPEHVTHGVHLLTPEAEDGSSPEETIGGPRDAPPGAGPPSG